DAHRARRRRPDRADRGLRPRDRQAREGRRAEGLSGRLARARRNPPRPAQRGSAGLHPGLNPVLSDTTRRQAMTNPKLEQLTPQNCQVIFIDHQPQMAFGVQSIDRQVLKNNTVALAKSAKIFDIPVTITTVETESFSGYTYPE